jgi:hypothetical protein
MEPNSRSLAAIITLLLSLFEPQFGFANADKSSPVYRSGMKADLIIVGAGLAVYPRPSLCSLTVSWSCSGSSRLSAITDEPPADVPPRSQALHHQSETKTRRGLAHPSELINRQVASDALGSRDPSVPT